MSKADWKIWWLQGPWKENFRAIKACGVQFGAHWTLLWSHIPFFQWSAGSSGDVTILFAFPLAVVVGSLYCCTKWYLHNDLWGPRSAVAVGNQAAMLTHSQRVGLWQPGPRRSSLNNTEHFPPPEDWGHLVVERNYCGGQLQIISKCCCKSAFLFIFFLFLLDYFLLFFLTWSSVLTLQMCHPLPLLTKNVLKFSLNKMRIATCIFKKGNTTKRKAMITFTCTKR